VSAHFEIELAHFVSETTPQNATRKNLRTSTFADRNILHSTHSR